MPTLIANHPLLWSTLLLLVDVLLWHAAPYRHRWMQVAVRLMLFLAFSSLIITAGVSPLLPPPEPDSTLLQMGATALAIIWWVYAARVLTELLGLALMHRIGHSGRLLQDVMGAVIFLIAIVAAAGYVLQLPVKGLLATSGAMAIIVGLALQSTLSDVFSGIVLNTTKPYQVDDWISIDGTEGKVVDIDWRATHLLNSSGSTAVIPNSVAAKAKIVNLSRPANVHGISISLLVPNHVRPRKVIDALERAVQGCNSLLLAPAAKVLAKDTGEIMTEYVISGFIATLAQRGEVRSQLFDLAHRHLEAAGISRLLDGPVAPTSRARTLLDEVKIFRVLGMEDKDRLAEGTVAKTYAAGQVIMELDELSESLLVIATGVVSAAVPEGDTMVEVGRMGPSEIMGEMAVLGDVPSTVRFTALTSCVVYRLDKALVQECVSQQVEVTTALRKLQAVRQQNSHSVLVRKAPAATRNGLMKWLKKR